MLAASNISVHLDGEPVLTDVTFSIPERAKYGLVGRNGAGKSTLMRILTGELEPDSGRVQFPKGSRIGYLEQDAPSGTISPLEFVLSAHEEAASLLLEAETCCEPQRLAEIHERLNIIDAYSAPARAAKMLAGLGFTDEMQARSMNELSGGWRMRVALASLLFSQPDILLLDEPSNHLDLEATIWLESYLREVPATMLVISHERHFLNNVVNHILHLQGGSATVYDGGYDAFECQRRERQFHLDATRERLSAQREKLEAFVNRWRAKSHTAKQAQSRLKALSKLEPIAEAASDPTLHFDFPSPNQLKPPMMDIQGVSVGYESDKPVLKNVSLRLDPSDRLALMGRNGNGKTTLARLLSGDLRPILGKVIAAGKLRVGFFTQYQVEELDRELTPLEHMTRLMPDEPQKLVRGQLGRFGFSGEMATRAIDSMSGGERARLALALITKSAPHLLILDEPTNHLDVDAREALVQALAEYTGAVVIVSHDRHMVELTADRLILVDAGTAKEFSGDLDDYINLILQKGESPPSPIDKSKKERDSRTKLSPDSNRLRTDLRKRLRKLEQSLAKLDALKNRLEQLLGRPNAEARQDSVSIANLLIEHAEVVSSIQQTEKSWIETSAALELSETSKQEVVQ